MRSQHVHKKKTLQITSGTNRYCNRKANPRRVASAPRASVYCRTIHSYIGRCWDFTRKPPRQTARKSAQPSPAKPNSAQHSQVARHPSQPPRIFQGSAFASSRVRGYTIDNCSVYFVCFVSIVRREWTHTKN